MAIRAIVASLLLAAASLSYAADAQPKELFVYDKADETVHPTMLDGPDNYDGAVLAGADGQWLTWLEFVPGKGDQVWVGARKGDAWVSRHAVVEKFGRYANPTLTRETGGRMWLTYEAEVNGQWDVLAAVVKPDATLGEVRAVSKGTGPDINHAAAAAKEGGIWVVWQGERDSRFHILASHVTESATTRAVVVSRDESSSTEWDFRDHWHPDVAVTPEGTLYVAWDGCTDKDHVSPSSFDVYARAMKAGKWTGIRFIAHEDKFEGRVSLAASTDGRVWLAWEEGEKNWGVPYTGGPQPNSKVNGMFIDDRGPLHRFRRLKLMCLKADTSFVETSPDDYPALPMPSMDKAMARQDAPKGVKATGAFYERGKLAVDGKGRPWIVYRQYYTPWLGLETIHHIESGFGVYARYLTDTGWSKLIRLDINQGDGMQRLSVSPQSDGVAVAYTTGRTDRNKNNRPRGLALTTLTGLGAAPAKSDAPGSLVSVMEDWLSLNGSGERPVRITSKEYHVYYGDLHRHTDLSLCFVPTDGTMDDAYRYAIDVAGLDFIGITDHTHDLVMGDALSQVWWRSTKEVTRHELKGRFMPIYSYERSRSDTDHNVFSLRADMLRPHTYPLPEFWKELDGDTFTIAHQPLNPKTWGSQDDAHRPLLEIYQGCRDRSIEPAAHAGLSRGYLLGFICSSDHLSTSASYAGVWAESCTREAIFRSLQARRTFGATTHMRILTRADDHVMGERFEAAEFPEIAIEVSGTSNIDSLQIVVDGQNCKTLRPWQSHVTTTYKPDQLGPGMHYLYVHALQPDGNQAWSSPIWVNVVKEKSQ
jgi:hypothetical protein